MAFYHFLAVFPALVVSLALAARLPHMDAGLRNAISAIMGQVLPAPVCTLLRQLAAELDAGAHLGFPLLSACAGALWAAFNGTWAVIYGLNTAYEVKERRSKWRLAATIAGITFALATVGLVAICILFATDAVAARLFSQSFPGVRVLQWGALVLALLCCFSLTYRFAPDLRDPEWRWSTPGALCALILWIGASLGMRFYFEHVSDDARTYGHLNSVVMLLLWLYVTNGAILIGGEMNSEIEKAAAERGDRHNTTPRERAPGSHKS
jgi:membrane protein